MRSILIQVILIIMVNVGFSQSNQDLFNSLNRSKLSPMPEYFDRYINLVEDVPLHDAFKKSINQLDHLDLKKLKAIGDKVYAPGKWTVKDILQHLIDAERILNYRVLRFARHDTTAAPNFDQEQVALNVKTDKRTLPELITELKIVRQSTISLFESFDDETMRITGVNWKYKISVLAMGFNILGHQKHHLHIIEERYYGLIK
jgi:hypothetical protein